MIKSLEKSAHLMYYSISQKECDYEEIQGRGVF